MDPAATRGYDAGTGGAVGWNLRDMDADGTFHGIKKGIKVDEVYRQGLGFGGVELRLSKCTK